MKITHRLFVAHVLALSCVLALASPALAGGPIQNCSSGVSALWPAGGANVPFNPDLGNLGPLAHADAVVALQGAFDVWGAVPSSTVTYTNAGELSVDVDITNFGPFLNPVAPDGLSAIVFDDTGEIFDLLFGPGSGILGFAGPEFLDNATCQILEGVSFLNGPSFTNATAARDVMVHEFGHYSGLGHTVVNGQNLGFADETGPTPFNTFGDAPLTEIETMYPFYFGPGSGTETVENDDVAAISTLYPEATFFGSTGTISGTIFSPNGTTKLTGINVIARNTADSFNDAVSAISGDSAFDNSSSDPRAGTYTINGLTPGAQYAVYVDGILAGGFSTTPRSLPGVEEFFNGGGESADPTTDDPSAFTAVASVAGSPSAGTNIVFNRRNPGPIDIGDDDTAEIFPPFKLRFCGTDYESFFINSNGSVTFGAGSTAFSESDLAFLTGPPRIAGLWDDLDPTAGGVVSFAQTANDVTVSFDAVPEFGAAAGANTFSIRMFRSPLSVWTTRYGAVSMTDGLAGFSCGGGVTSGFEKQSDLSATPIVLALNKTAVWETFNSSDNDLANRNFIFAGPLGFRDTFERAGHRNDSLATATRVELPFQSTDGFSTIDPAIGDVDYYKFEAKAGDIITVETVPGRSAMDTFVGLFGGSGLLASNDDGGSGVLSRLLVRIVEDGTYTVAVTTFGDADFDGVGGSDSGRYDLSIVKYRGDLLDTGDDGAVEVPFGFSFPFQGQSWSSLFVNGNGNLTFGVDDADFSETVDEFLAGAPRVAPLWDDLFPPNGLVIAEPKDDRLLIHYASVPEFFSDRPNYFSTEMREDGRIRTGYLATARGDGLVGVTPGAGAADPGESDLSRRTNWPAVGTTYELFEFEGVSSFSDFDLYFDSLRFRP